MMDWLIVTLLTGAAVGFGGGWACWKSQIEVLKETHAREIQEWADEQKRLRAQVARIVGCEPLGVKCITEADCLPTSTGNTPADIKLAA